MLQRETFRQMMKDPNTIIHAVGAHNGLSAKLVEKNGFQAVWSSGFEISTTYGVPDANILSMTEFLYATKQIVEATTLPVVADCDTGFGNVNNVVKMIKEYEKVGVAAVCIEDKIFPKVNSFIAEGQELSDPYEFCSKIIAAKQTQTDPDLVVIARVEALIAGKSMNEALARATMYAEAGADMILIHSKKNTEEEIVEFSSKWNHSIPLVIVPTTYPNISYESLAKNKIKMVIYANQSLRAAVKASDQVLKKLKETNSLASIESELETMDTLFELQGMNKMVSDAKHYEAMAKKLNTPFTLINP